MQGDELLLRRACKGDVQAFEELMQSHESRIYAIALRMMGNREDAQDCAQEAMVRIYRAMGLVQGSVRAGHMDIPHYDEYLPG